MPEQTTEKQAPTLEEVETRFEAWRNAGKRRRPIPEKLWRLAAELSPSYPASRISRVLRLNYYGLKRRVENANAPRPAVRKEPSAPGKPVFVELGVPASFPAACRECAIETKSVDGSETKIVFRGESCPDPIEICRILWRNDR
jgi:hypothetical protein